MRHYRIGKCNTNVLHLDCRQAIFSLFSEFHDKSGESDKNQVSGRQHIKSGDSQSN